MKTEHIIVGQIYAAQKDVNAADELVKKYMPYIRTETIKFINPSSSEYDDYLSVAMFAFYEAVMAYNRSKGAFLKFASVVIKNKLIDYKRRENKHSGILSLDATLSEEDDRTLLERTEDVEDSINELQSTSEAKREIGEFTQALKKFDLELSDIADNCPKQTRTLKACMKVLDYAKRNPELLKVVESTGKLPLSQLAAGSNVNRKLLERHRKYIVAILLAYTNGFEVIREHLKELSKKKGEDGR